MFLWTNVQSRYLWWTVVRIGKQWGSLHSGLFGIKLHPKDQSPLIGLLNLLKKKRNLLYIRNQSVPRCKHFPPRL